MSTEIGMIIKKHTGLNSSVNTFNVNSETVGLYSYRFAVLVSCNTMQIMDVNQSNREVNFAGTP